MHSLIDFLGFIIVKASSSLLNFVPLRIALWIGRRGGNIVYLVNSKRRSIAYANLKSVFSEKNTCQIKRILKSHYENLGMSVIETLKLPGMGKRYLERHVIKKDFDRIKEALDKKKGVILLTAHFGNWEIASLAASADGYRMSVFAREQKYTRLNNLLNKYREMTGCKVIAKGFSVRDIIKTLNNNGIVGMLIDQDAGPNGVFINFLGRPASVAQGALKFSLKTGAVILPSFVRRIDYDKHLIEIVEPLELVSTQEKEKDIKVNLEKVVDILEDYIRKFPEQWLWSHKRWKSTPQRTVLVLSDGKTGHLNQAMAITETIEEALSHRLKARGIEASAIVKIHVVELKFKNRSRRAFLDIASLFSTSRSQGCLKALRFCLEEDSFYKIKNRYADVIISCGASTVAANIFLKYENNAKGIVIMKPGLGRSKKFDLVVLPRHDAPLALSSKGSGRGKGVPSNVFITEVAPNRITERLMKDAVLRNTKYEIRNTNHGLGLLIGGDTKNFRLTTKAVENAVNGILKIAEERGLDIFISTSRRTSKEIDCFLKDRLTKSSRCKLLVIANEKNIPGAVPAIFGLSELVVVSPDSISMISEAISSGKHVVVFSDKRPLDLVRLRPSTLLGTVRPSINSGRILSIVECIRGVVSASNRSPQIARGRQARSKETKYEKVIKNLEEKGYIKTVSSDEIYDVVKELLREKPIVKKLEDRKRIIERLQAII